MNNNESMGVTDTSFEVLDSLVGAFILIVIGGVSGVVLFDTLSMAPNEPTITNLIYVIPIVFIPSGVIYLVRNIRG